MLLKNQQNPPQLFIALKIFNICNSLLLDFLLTQLCRNDEDDPRIIFQQWDDHTHADDDNDIDDGCALSKISQLALFGFFGLHFSYWALSLHMSGW